MSQVFDPYATWLGIAPGNHPPDHYALLGLRPFEEDLQVIRESAQHRATTVRRQAAGEHAEMSERILHDLAAATECLLDPHKKANYDDCLRKAQRMDDTRTMSEDDLDVAAGSNGFGPLRWGGADRTEVVASDHGQDDKLSGTIVEDDREADSQSSWGSHDSSGELADQTSGDVMDAAAQRRPLIAVILISSVLGILLVASVGLLAGIFGTRPFGTTADRQPAHSASEDSLNRTQSPAEITNPSDAVRESVDVAVAAADSAPGTPTAASAEGEVAAVPPDDSPVDGPIDDTLLPADDASDSAAGTPSPLPAASRIPIPAMEQWEHLVVQIDEQYGIDRLNAPGPILDLAEELFELSREPLQPPASQFAVLVKVIQLAGKAGDPVVAFSAAERIRSVFDVADDRVEQLLAEALGERIDEGRQRWQRFVEARDAIALEPSDPIANSELGMYFCFVRDDWKRGLLHLAQGENTTLRFLAEKELFDVDTWQKRLELGDDWWDVSLLSEADQKAAVQERAAHWYRLALPDLEVTDRSRVTARLASLIALPGTSEPGARAEEDPHHRMFKTHSADGQPPTDDDKAKVDLSGTWRSERFGSVFRLDDQGKTVRCELVSSKMVSQVDGLWFRDKGQLLSDRWRFRFVDDPVQRFWELGCRPEVVDDKTIRLRAELVVWNRLGREVERRWETAVWRKVDTPDGG